MIPNPTVLITILIALTFLPKDNQAAGEVPPPCKDVRDVGMIYLESRFHINGPADRQLLQTRCNTFQPKFAKQIRSYFILPGVRAACEFYDDDICQGNSLWVAEDRSDGTVHDNEARSAKCGIQFCNDDYAGAVFEDPKFNGASQTLKMGWTTIDLTSWKTGVSSYVIFPSKWCYFVPGNCAGAWMRVGSRYFEDRSPLMQNQWMSDGNDATRCTYCVPN